MKRFGIKGLAAVALAALFPFVSLAQGYFESPSSGNTYRFMLKNRGESEIHQVKVQSASVTSNPAGILNPPQLQLPTGQHDIAPQAEPSYDFTNLSFGAITTKQQCEEFQNNPTITVIIEAQEPLAVDHYEDVELKVKPEGFESEQWDGMCPPSYEVEKCECVPGRCTYSETRRNGGGDDCGAGPGGESRPPDDNVIVSDFDEDEIANYDPEAKVGVLTAGYFKAAAQLTEALNVPIVTVNPDEELRADLAERVSVLIIPSSGLSAYASSESFLRNLEEYVANGGNVIVLSQPRSEEWAAVPGGWDAFGYNQDVSCYSIGSFPGSYHPVVSSEDRSYRGIGKCCCFRFLAKRPL